MDYTVITTFNQAGLELYGQRMIDNFEKFWPQSVKLKVYAENCRPRVSRSNTEILDILEVSSACREFVERHKNNPQAHGGLGSDNQAVYVKNKAFRWQAVRFCFKVFALQHAVNNTESDRLIWLDADTVTHTPVPLEWLGSVCPDGVLASYLGRTDQYHSECGWIGYNLHDALTRPFIDSVTGLYITDELFNYPEWHDSFLWDIIRKQYRDELKANFFNINPDPDTKGRAKHPFINSELGRYMDHMKGDRKDKGHSNSNEVVLHQDNPYWRNVIRSLR